MAELTWHGTLPSDSQSSSTVPITPEPQVPEYSFEPCASTASLFLYAQGSVILCLHHDTLAIERRFTLHRENIYFISVDNVSERGAGRLVVSYDVGQTAIVWDLFTGSEIARFASFEHLRVAAWMRNGNVAFGNGKGEVILFEPSTSEHISARTIFDPITALAPSSDCRTYAIGYQNGSILIAALHPIFTILHTLTTSRGPSPIVALTWHASSSKQKSDMLATQNLDGDLRIWSLAKSPGNESPRVIRALKRSEACSFGPKWISWSKNGRIVQYSDRETWAWDVRTKHVTYEPIPTIDEVRGLANYGPTATLFTLGPNHTVQQYDLEYPSMVANVQHLPIDPASMSVEGSKARPISPPTLRPAADIKELGGMSTIRQTTAEMDSIEAALQRRARTASPVSSRSHTNSISSKASSGRYRGPSFSPVSRSAHSGTTFSLTSAGGRTTPQLSATSMAYPSSVSMSSVAGSKTGSRLRNEVFPSPADKPLRDLFPFTSARVNDVPYKQHRPLDETHLTPDDLRRQMLSVVFGWDDDIEGLIRDELSQHAPGSQNAILLSRWLGESDPDQMVSMISSGSISTSDWMLLALSQMGGQAQANKVGQAFVQRLLEMGDIHTSATILLGLGDRNDAIEVYVSRNRYMEAILMTCLLTPSDWQRQSYLVRRWGEHVVQNSEQQLAIRCFMCTGAEPSDPWTSPTAPQVNSFLGFHEKPSPIASPEPQTVPDPNASPPTAQSKPATNDRLKAKNSALKLITSFGPLTNPSFRFPGLKSDDRTPTNAPGVTPIAESAIGESALTPGGLGSYRLNNVRSINNTMSARTVTPGGYSSRRLPSIGETPIDVQPPAFPAPKSLPTPVDSGSDQEKRSAIESGEQQQDKHLNDGGEALLLLTSARYDPGNEAHDPSPQTAIQAGREQLEITKGPPSPPAAVFETFKQQSRSRDGSRDRKPDGLHIELPTAGLSQQIHYGRADTLTQRAFTPTQYQSDATSEARSPASTSHSYRSTKSPSVSGRSIDQYISSLDEANYYAKYHGQPIQTRERRDTDTDGASRSSGKQRSRNASRDARGRTNQRYIQPAKRSPSSPIPMSPDEFSQYNTSTETFEETYRAKGEAGKIRSRSKLRTASSRTRASSSAAERRRQHSSSRTKASSRTRSRRRSRDHSTRERSSDRDGFGLRSPSSGLPLSPSGEENNERSDLSLEDNLRLVTVDRERRRSRQRSASRRPERGTSARRDPSPDRRRTRTRSQSRQARERGVSAQRERDYRTRERSVDGWRKESSDVVSDEHRRPTPAPSAGPVSAVERRRKELAAAELEARRLSLVRRPSAPNIPLPGEIHHVKSASDSPPLSAGSFSQRAHDRNKAPTSKSSPEYPNSSDSGSSRGPSGVPVGLPATPRAMRHPKYSSYYGDADAPAVPEIPEKLAVVTDGTYQGESGRIGRSMSVPAEKLQPDLPADLPAHPYYKPEIPRSRSTSRTRPPGHRRESSRDLRSPSSVAHGSSPSVTVSIEETLANTMPRVEPRKVQNPPLIPELQHLSTPPPPPPPPVSGEGQSPQNSTGTIDIAIENDPIGRSLPRAMTAAPTMTAEARPSREQRRISFDHRRGRSINESFTTKIRNFTDRMRSTSRSRNNAQSPPVESPDKMSPYESVQSMNSFDNRI